MKKLYIVALALVVAFSISACGKNDNNETSAPTTSPTTAIDIIPDMKPIEPNIPDPSVDSSMPMYTEATNNTQSTTNSTNGGMSAGNNGQSSSTN